MDLRNALNFRLAGPKICTQDRPGHICPYGHQDDQDRTEVRIQTVDEPETSEQRRSCWHSIKPIIYKRRRQAKA